MLLRPASSVALGAAVLAAAAMVTAAGSASVDARWPDRSEDGLRGVVPYELVGLDQGVAELVLREMRGLELATGVLEFVPRTAPRQDQYVSVEASATHCTSYVGVQRGKTQVQLAPECAHEPGVVLHHLLHALGFWHEHQRPDRDNHVRVIWDNIVPGGQHNFARRRDTDALGTPYDPHSVLHPGLTSLSKGPQATCDKFERPGEPCSLAATLEVGAACVSVPKSPQGGEEASLEPCGAGGVEQLWHIMAFDDVGVVFRLAVDPFLCLGIAWSGRRLRLSPCGMATNAALSGAYPFEMQRFQLHADGSMRWDSLPTQCVRADAAAPASTLTAVPCAADSANGEATAIVRVGEWQRVDETFNCASFAYQCNAGEALAPTLELLDPAAHEPSASEPGQLSPTDVQELQLLYTCGARPVRMGAACSSACPCPAGLGSCASDAACRAGLECSASGVCAAPECQAGTVVVHGGSRGPFASALLAALPAELVQAPSLDAATDYAGGIQAAADQAGFELANAEEVKGLGGTYPSTTLALRVDAEPTATDLRLACSLRRRLREYSDVLVLCEVASELGRLAKRATRCLCDAHFVDKGGGDADVDADAAGHLAAALACRAAPEMRLQSGQGPEQLCARSLSRAECNSRRGNSFGGDSGDGGGPLRLRQRRVCRFRRAEGCGPRRGTLLRLRPSRS